MHHEGHPARRLGTTSRPGSASGPRGAAAGGRASAETRIRSHGRAGGPAEHERVCSGGRPPTPSRRAARLRRPMREVRARSRPRRPRRWGRRGGRAGPSSSPEPEPDVEDAVPGLHVEQAQHVGDGPRLRAASPRARWASVRRVRRAAAPRGGGSRPRHRRRRPRRRRRLHRAKHARVQDVSPGAGSRAGAETIAPSAAAVLHFGARTAWTAHRHRRRPRRCCRGGT